MVGALIMCDRAVCRSLLTIVQGRPPVGLDPVGNSVRLLQGESFRWLVLTIGVGSVRLDMQLRALSVLPNSVWISGTKLVQRINRFGAVDLYLSGRVNLPIGILNKIGIKVDPSKIKGVLLFFVVLVLPWGAFAQFLLNILLVIIVLSKSR